MLLAETVLATSTLRHSRIREHAPRRASRVNARCICPERRIPIGFQGSGFARQPSVCKAQCRAAKVASVAETLPPYSRLFAAVPISHHGVYSNTVGSAGAPLRLSARAGRASLHHRFVSARAVSVRRASVLAKCGAQLQLVRTGRKRRTISWHRGGPPQSMTLCVTESGADHP